MRIPILKIRSWNNIFPNKDSYTSQGSDTNTCWDRLSYITSQPLQIFYLFLALKQLEQLERLRSEITPATPWLPILVIHIRSHVKTTQSQSYKFLKIAKIWNFAKNFARNTPPEVAW